MNIVFVRLLLSGLIAFFFYAAWAYYANSLVTDDKQLLYKAAIVQGSYSGTVTLVFTFTLEVFYKVFKNKSYCLPFIIPTLSLPLTSTFSKPSPKETVGKNRSMDKHDSATKRTFESTLQASEKAFNGVCLPGIILAPLPAIMLQGVFVIAVNIVFNTPNLWLTVAPSIFFSAIYGYLYTVSLSKKLKHAQA